MIKLSITVRYSMKTLAYTILKDHHDPLHYTKCSSCSVGNCAIQ